MNLRTDASQIAAGLSEAQRDVLLRHSGRSPQRWGGRSSMIDPDWDQGRRLKSAGLIRWAEARSSDTCLTPLGLEVRRFLQDRQP